MYAVIKTGGKQYRVQPGAVIDVERLQGVADDTITLDTVTLLSPEGGNVSIGTPFVAGATVRATIVAQARAEKIILFKYKSKKRYRRTQGHRQEVTRLRIEGITQDGQEYSSATPATV